MPNKLGGNITELPSTLTVCGDGSVGGYDSVLVLMSGNNMLIQIVFSFEPLFTGFAFECTYNNDKSFLTKLGSAFQLPCQQTNIAQPRESEKQISFYQTTLRG